MIYMSYNGQIAETCLEMFSKESPTYRQQRGGGRERSGSMAAAVLTRQEAVEELKKHGITGTSVYLIDIIPLIEMAWADGRIQHGELAILDNYLVRHIGRINDLAGYQVLTIEDGRRFLERFIAERPSKELLRTLRGFIRPVRLSSSDYESCLLLRESLLAACLDIAASSVTEYPYGLDGRFEASEKRCFFEILESLPPDVCTLA
jgi:hypothetical protein